VQLSYHKILRCVAEAGTILRCGEVYKDQTSIIQLCNGYPFALGLPGTCITIRPKKDQAGQHLLTYIAYIYNRYLVFSMDFRHGGRLTSPDT